MAENLWILTEEKPKKYLIEKIASELVDVDVLDKDSVKIQPIFDGQNFSRTYKVEGLEIENIKSVFIKLISGNSSFVDYLVYLTENEPSPEQTPEMAIEETKTNIAESRNQFLQRITKFPFLDTYYDTRSIMAWTESDENIDPSATTFELAIKIFKTLDVEIWGLHDQQEEIDGFESVDKFIDYVNSRPAPSNGHKVRMEKKNDRVEISIKLDKGSEGKGYYNKISHDPNIGFSSALIGCLRKLGYEKDIVLVDHHVKEYPSGGIGRSKLVKIMSEYDAYLKDLPKPGDDLRSGNYWYYENSSEKAASIFLHVLFENYENCKVIYDNHAGSGQKYLDLPDGREIQVNKKWGKPDIIVEDLEENNILIIEGEKGSNRDKGIKQLETFDQIEDKLRDEYSSFDEEGHSFERCVVLFSESCILDDEKVYFYLSKEGEIEHQRSPLIKRALDNATR